jgi:hypothetical protein
MAQREAMSLDDAKGWRVECDITLTDSEMAQVLSFATNRAVKTTHRWRGLIIAVGTGFLLAIFAVMGGIVTSRRGGALAVGGIPGMLVRAMAAI